MNNFTDFIEVAGAVIGATGLAISLEWLSLNALLRLMPAREKHAIRRVS